MRLYLWITPWSKCVNHRSDGTTLTVRSLRYLQLTDPGDMVQFCEVYKNSPLKRQTVITCLNTLKKSMADEDAISCLVLGTEDKSIYVLDPEAFTVLATVSGATFLACLLTVRASSLLLIYHLVTVREPTFVYAS